MSLPADALIEIFSLVADPNNDDGHLPFNKTVASLASVCREWRGICRQHGKLWSRIKISTQKEASIFKLSLESAKNWVSTPLSSTHPLTFILYLSETPDFITNRASLADFLAEYQHRVGSLDLFYSLSYSEQQTAEWLPIDGTWPLLECFKITVEGTNPMPNFPTSVLSSNCTPALRTLHLELGDDVALPLDNVGLRTSVSSLNLGPCADEDLADLLGFLQHFPGIETLTIALSHAPWMIAGQCEWVGCPVRLGKVENLTLECEGIYEAYTEVFQFLELPSLDTLTIKFPDIDDYDHERDETSEAISDLGYVTDFLKNSCCAATLTSLTLTHHALHACTNGSLATLLSSLLSLSSLTLDMPLFNFRPLRTALKSQLSSIELICTEPRRQSLRKVIRTTHSLMASQSKLDFFLVRMKGFQPRASFTQEVQSCLAEAERVRIPLSIHISEY